LSRGSAAFWDMQDFIEDLFRISLRLLGPSLIFEPKMPRSSSRKSAFKNSTISRRHSFPPPDWHLPFEIMCNASDYAVGVVLDQSKDKKQYAISYARKTLTGLQLNYATMEKELLAVIFAIEKFMS
jgi:hypothetical protein